MRLDERTRGALFTGFAARVIAGGLALWTASYGVIALCDALERVRAALPH